MTLHRFFSGETKDRGGVLELSHELWVNDPALVNQVLRVLRMRVGEELVLFDGKSNEILYRISEIEPQAFQLKKVTDFVPKLPPKKVTLAWSLLKKDKNEWVLQKATELGVSHFAPLVSDRTEKLGFDMERAHSIVVEASEQCGRHDIPSLQEPMKLREFIGQHMGSTAVFVADMDGNIPQSLDLEHVIVVVGPEGGWTDDERAFFKERDIPSIGLGHFTLRAETAAITAVQKLV
jgi:16S rRNA (uracil1498-N3)-methyltransferase